VVVACSDNKSVRCARVSTGEPAERGRGFGRRGGPSSLSSRPRFWRCWLCYSKNTTAEQDTTVSRLSSSTQCCSRRVPGSVSTWSQSVDRCGWFTASGTGIGKRAPAAV